MSSTSITRRSALKLGAGAMALAAGAGMMASSNIRAARAGEAEGAVFSEPGTYTAEGPGRYGPVTVTMTASADAIESIETSSNETVTIGGYALDTLTDQVLEFQSVEFDNISGATFTCSAFRTALTSCIEQAGGDLSKLSGEIVIPPVDYETAADVLVIGAGGAGLSAALTAAEEGASVILIEKAPFYGGNTNASHSGINVVNSTVLEGLGSTGTEEGFIETQTNELVNPEIVQAFAVESGPAADWIAGLGVDFEMSANNEYQLTCEEPASHTGVTIMRAIKSAIDDQPAVSFYPNTTATALIADESGTVTGAVATDKDGNEVTFTATSVIVCTGGFGRDHDLVVELRPDLENTITDEIAPTTGDGLTMTEVLDAGTVDLDQMQVHNRCCPGYGMIISADTPGGRSTPAGIFVNSEAKRIGPETNLPDDLILSQEEGTMYHIFPAEYGNSTFDAMIATHFAYEEDTVAALANDLGLDPDALTATVDAWNEGAVDGVDTEFGREDGGVGPIEGPVIGYCFRLAVHYCMGGITFDTLCHALDGDGNVINGLYACGECTGGLHGNYRVDGSALSDGFTFGHVAGRVAAEAALA